MHSVADLEIRSVGNDFVEGQWDEISRRLSAAVSASRPSEDLPSDRPAQYIWAEIHKPGGSALKHVLALNEGGALLGAFFCIPTDRSRSKTSADLGWFFTDENLPESVRAKIADAVIEKRPYS